MRILTVMTAVLAAFASIIPLQAAAEALPLVYFQIRAQHSDKCLTVAGAAVTDGSNVEQRTCVGPFEENQLWRLVDTGDNDTYYIVAQHSDKCLDVRAVGTADGTPIQQWTCLGYSQANQRWRLYWQNSNYYSILPAHVDTFMCLDVRDGGTTDGLPTEQRFCNGARPSQKWRLLSS